MQKTYETILKAAQAEAGVIIYGESGTGKEMVAHTIHELSHRSAGPFVTVNCGAVLDTLIESEFFGYKIRGVYRGGSRQTRLPRSGPWGNSFSGRSGGNSSESPRSSSCEPLKEAVTLREIDIPATPDPVAHFETFSSIPPFSDTSSSSLADALNAAEKTYIAQCLHAHKWKRGRVAEILGIDRRTLFRKMKSHGLL